jgi:branched-chain amino acid transport system substrate-binding protein
VRSRLKVATTACVVGLTTACGGVATQDGGSGDAAECGDEVRIGAPYPLSGVWAENGQNALQGMELAADEINEAGGIEALDGATISIVSADTSSDNPAQAKAVTEGLLQSGDMAAVVGSYLSSMTLTTAIATETGQVPIISQSFVDELTAKGYQFMFQIAPKASVFGTKTVENMAGVFEAQDRELASIAIAGSDDASSRAQAEAVAAAAESQGIAVSALVIFPNSLSDATPIVSQLADANADAIVIGSNLSDTSLIIRGLRSRGVEVPVVAPGGGGVLTPQFSDTLGPDAEGVMASSAWNADLQLEGVEEAAAAYLEEHGVFMAQEAGESWVAVHQLAQLMEESATCDPKELRDALADAEFTEGPAAAMPPGQVGYDETGANEFVEPVMVQWQGGELRTVFPEDVAAVDALPLPGA